MAKRIGKRSRKVKILATLGPASNTPEMIEKLFAAGVDAFRINMSHGEQAVHAQTIGHIRKLESRVQRPITVLCDLQGPKLRVGKFEGGEAYLKHGSHFTLDIRSEPGNAERVQLPHRELFGVL